jgi:UPF0042 nucleotide-binding protein
MGEFVVITGMSGAGRTQVAKTLEDLGWFVIDNLPPTLMPKVAELVQMPGSSIERVALATRTETYLDELTQALVDLRSRADRVRIIFLEAADEVLVNRYEDTRRRHPLAEGGNVAEAIVRERELLEPIKAEADVVVDTSDLNVHELRDRIRDLFGADGLSDMQTHVLSFGYKHGHPLDADLVFDVRFLPNPHWVEELRPLTGLDEPVRKYVMDQLDTGEFLRRLDHLLDLLLPAYVKEGKSYLTIAVGCTGGHHRSVVIGEEIAKSLRRRGFDPKIRHRDVDR